MERLGQVDAVALDKTGTLTEGTPRVIDIRPLSGGGLDADALLALAAAVEHPSEHPLARAVVQAAREHGLALPEAAGFTSTPGAGVTATVGGHTIQVGSPARLATDRGPDTDGVVRALEEEGRTAVLVLRDGMPVGVLGIADRLRPDAEATVAALTALTGRTPVLLTGDNERAARRLAAEVGITDVRAGLLPENKVAAVKEWEAKGRRVLVVGDGVNDAPALAAAHTGIAMGKAGSDLALETADAVVVRDELATIPAVVALSRRARSLVVQNLVIAGIFITALVAWDLIATLPLPLGVAGHEGSTVIVGLNGLRLLREAAWPRLAKDTT
jgi:P-type E1-E2 ATPase